MARHYKRTLPRCRSCNFCYQAVWIWFLCSFCWSEEVIAPSSLTCLWPRCITKGDYKKLLALNLFEPTLQLNNVRIFSPTMFLIGSTHLACKWRRILTTPYFWHNHICSMLLRIFISKTKQQSSVSKIIRWGKNCFWEILILVLVIYNIKCALFFHRKINRGREAGVCL